jgi:hypothetical protein
MRAHILAILRLPAKTLRIPVHLRIPANLSGPDIAACTVAAMAMLCTLFELVWPHPFEAKGNGATAVAMEAAPTTPEPERERPDPRAIAERPLFTVDRKPYQVPVSVPDNAALLARQEPREPEVSFELRAVIRTSSANIALLLVSGETTPTRLRPGDQIAGWTLREVENESVRLERNGREMRVVLHSKNNDSRDG